MITQSPLANKFTRETLLKNKTAAIEPPEPHFFLAESPPACPDLAGLFWDSAEKGKLIF